MEIWNIAAPLIRKMKPSIVSLVDQAGGELTDEVVIDIAGKLHPLLPFPARLAVSRSALATLLVSNKHRIGEFLQ
jgi:hypothetical protein